MREIELKGLVENESASRARLVAAGARLVFEGELTDRRYDMPNASMFERDEVLRLRIVRSAEGERARLEFKGAASFPDGYKLREEIGTSVDDAATMHDILCALGFIVTREIDRHIASFELTGTMVRFERYPRMDTLVEVEGEPESIERAIAALGIPRPAFTTDCLADFVRRYERRTGMRGAVSKRELAGDFRYDVDGA
ncbi:MAG: class IV adenylate cyclase [Gemmatimonadaceae bacterium]